MNNELFGFSNKNILMISPEIWGDNLLSKHHIAITLAEFGAKIWFVAPYTGRGERQAKSPHRNIKLIVHKNFIGLSSVSSPIARIIARLEVRNLRKQIDLPIDIVWSFDPYHLQFLRLFMARITIYHPVDNHYTKLEHRVIREADLVISNSDATLSRLNHKHKYKLGHGIASYFFSPPTHVDLPGNYKIKIGYVGNLTNRLFDFDLYSKLIKNYPEIGFYAIGPRESSNLSQQENTFDWTDLDCQSNFFWLGQQQSSNLPSFLCQMDILLVLYKSDNLGLTVNPHKMLEYLSSGKLIITSSHLENEAFDSLLLQADSLDDIQNKLDYALENLESFLSPEVCATRIAKASTWTYVNRLRELELKIRDYLSKA